jgi:hypothetical protein
MESIKSILRKPLAKVMVLVLILAMISAGTTAVLAKGSTEITNSNGNTVHGCYHNKSGVLRIVDSPDECRKQESAISWQRECECPITTEQYQEMLARLEALEQQVPPDGTPCDDGSLCTENDVYVDGECVGTPIDCDDGNPCTDDLCDPATGCYHEYNNDPCDDGIDCTNDDTCAGGDCAGVPSIENCDDVNPCTKDECDPVNGCLHTPEPDGTPCGVDAHCVGGHCQDKNPE